MKGVYIAAMHSISFNGNAATWYVERAGALAIDSLDNHESNILVTKENVYISKSLKAKL